MFESTVFGSDNPCESKMIFRCDTHLEAMHTCKMCSSVCVLRDGLLQEKEVGPGENGGGGVMAREGREESRGGVTVRGGGEEDGMVEDDTARGESIGGERDKG